LESKDKSRDLEETETEVAEQSVLCFILVLRLRIVISSMYQLVTNKQSAASNIMACAFLTFQEFVVLAGAS
jgi:hypothetical protein